MPETAPLIIEYYTLPGCYDCDEYEGSTLHVLRTRLQDEGIETRLIIRSVLEPEAFKALSEALAARGVDFGGTPIIIAAGEVLQGNDLSEHAAYGLLRKAYGASPAAPAQGTSSITISAPPFWVSVGAGLADGINPCATTVLLFLISAMALSGRNRSAVLPVGFGFTLGVFTAYLLAGFGFLAAADFLIRVPSFSYLIRAGTTLVLCALALLSIRDAVLCAQGRISEAALKMPAPLSSATHALIRKGRNRPLAAGSAFLLGGAVSVLEFVCTGQVYLPTIVYIARTAPSRGIGLLVAYNVAFVLPLVAVFLLVHFGISHALVASFFRRHLALGKGILAGVFALLALVIALR